MTIEDFTKLLDTRFGDDDNKKEKFIESYCTFFIDNKENQLNFKMFKESADNSNIKDGIYLTLRISDDGVYSMINEWKNGNWDLPSSDGGYTIMYTEFDNCI